MRNLGVFGGYLTVPKQRVRATSSDEASQCTRINIDAVTGRIGIGITAEMPGKKCVRRRLASTG